MTINLTFAALYVADETNDTTAFKKKCKNVMWIWPFNPALRCQVMQMGQGSTAHQQGDLDSKNMSGKKTSALVPFVSLSWHILFLLGISLSIRKHQMSSNAGIHLTSHILPSCLGLHLKNFIATLSFRGVLEIMWLVSFYVVQSGLWHFKWAGPSKLTAWNPGSQAQLMLSWNCYSHFYWLLYF